MSNVNPKIEYTEFSNEEFLSLSRNLEQYNSIFYKLWQLGKPVFTESLSTAAVSFDKEGQCILFCVNPQFWFDKTINEKMFIIIHECLHVILNHGVRAVNLRGKEHSQRQINVAMDLCVNYSIITRFGLLRIEVDPQNQYIWHDTVFTPDKFPKPVPLGKSFEYYYSLLKNIKEDENDGKTVDEHGDLYEISREDLEKIKQKISEQANESEIDEINNLFAGAGMGDSGFDFTIKKKKINVKRKWETVIKKWASKYLNSATHGVDQWATIHRRFTLLPSDMFLPSEMEIEDNVISKSRIQVWFFQDVSASCMHLLDRFFTAACTLPEDRFDVKLFTFDTKVTAIPDYKNAKNIRAGGGTYFNIIENYIQSKKNELGYPKAVFIITDGDGNAVKPEHPERWYWFLSEQCKQYIPKESSVYNLADFE